MTPTASEGRSRPGGRRRRLRALTAWVAVLACVAGTAQAQAPALPPAQVQGPAQVPGQAQGQAQAPAQPQPQTAPPSVPTQPKPQLQPQGPASSQLHNPAQTLRVPTPDEVKAAYVHRFAGFVEWPTGTFAAVDSPIVVGVAGAPGLHRELSQIVAGRMVQGRALQVIEVSQPREAASVHMLVIGRSAWKRAGDWMAATKGHPVLVVTDMAQGLERGAALGFVEIDSRLRFEASVPAAEQAGLRLSSRLLSVAERVVKAGP